MAAQQDGSRRAARKPDRERGEQARGRAARRREPDEGERDHDREKRRRVGLESHRIAECGHRGPGQGRAGDAAEIELGGIERDGGQELRLGHQVRQDRLLEGPDQGGRRPLQRDQQDERGRVVVTGGHQRREHDGARRRGEVPDDEYRPPRQPVGQGAADRRQQADGQECSGGDQDGPGRLAGLRDDQGADGDGLHPGSDIGNEPRRPKQREAAMPERPQRDKTAGRAGRLRIRNAGFVGGGQHSGHVTASAVTPTSSRRFTRPADHGPGPRGRMAACARFWWSSSGSARP